MRWGRLAAENHRGALVPRVLGLWLMASVTASTVIVAALDHVEPAGWGALAGSLLVAAAGLVDDLVPGGPRGLRGHVRALLDGHVTTGILKLMVTAACAVVVIAMQPVRPGWVRVAGVVLVAAGANLGNALDVRPGRALKFLLPMAALVGSAGVPFPLVPVCPGVALGGLVALPFDLRERAMLGDAGSNLLGFVIALGAFAALPDGGVLAVAAVAVGLNVLADTVTLSRAIEAVSVLRWYDRIGRPAGPA